MTESEKYKSVERTISNIADYMLLLGVVGGAIGCLYGVPHADSLIVILGIAGLIQGVVVYSILKGMAEIIHLLKEQNKKSGAE